MEKYKFIAGSRVVVEDETNKLAAQGYRPVQMTATTFMKGSNIETRIVVLLELQ